MIAENNFVNVQWLNLHMRLYLMYVCIYNTYNNVEVQVQKPFFDLTYTAKSLQLRNLHILWRKAVNQLKQAFICITNSISLTTRPLGSSLIS